MDSLYTGKDAEKQERCLVTHAEGSQWRRSFSVGLSWGLFPEASVIPHSVMEIQMDAYRSWEFPFFFFSFYYIFLGKMGQNLLIAENITCYPFNIKIDVEVLMMVTFLFSLYKPHKVVLLVFQLNMQLNSEE